MTQEEKNLLIKDLCTRLPYGVKIHAEFNGEAYDEELRIVNKSAMLGDYGPVPVVNSVEDDINDGFELINVKPYLRPMSSMTKEEKYEYRHMLGATLNSEGESIMFVYVEDFSIVVDWLNAHHFDYRGLIERGLALEAPEGMYKTE